MKNRYAVVMAAVVATLVYVPSVAATEPQGFGLHGVGGEIGLVSPDGPGSTVGLGGHANLGAFIPSAPNLIGMPNIQFWSSDSFTEISVNAVVWYVYPLPNSAGWAIIAGGGIGIIFTSFDFEFTNPFTGETTKDSASDTDFGFILTGGVKKAFSEKMSGFARAKFKLDGIDVFALFAGLTFSIGS